MQARHYLDAAGPVGCLRVTNAESHIRGPCNFHVPEVWLWLWLFFHQLTVERTALIIVRTDRCGPRW